MNKSLPSYPDLQGKVVMITGVSRGLGKALALAFAEAKSVLVLCSRGKEELAQTAAEVEKLGARCLSIAADVSVPRDAERLVATAEATFGRIDVLINNAAVLGPSPMPYLLDFPEEAFMEVMRVNTWGPFLVTRRAIAGMLARQSGSIINVTSEAGRVGYAGWGAYGVSKFALEGLTQTWAQEVEGTGVRVNMVDPGEMDTEMHRLAVPDCDYELADPREVVAPFLYLASDVSREVNGQRLLAEEFVGEEAES
ncbi:SDR family NAD(P)-dependent oxidoreductase [Polycladomyces subterraneus]|uniref:SDR family oxidoreductase n=1 Tax=Polycladomyces subterraneus TaxID=1016997 RepID=A0ABT8IRU2_9BACL|nr:SDR family oxidoreductase [Polycladomyces subterraneus]MDN4595508.1 SDR family oxidoreductase [Polycladomyces subterraneus]